jgi:epoxyqueuosine reductase
MNRNKVLQKARELGFHLAGIATVPPAPEPAEQEAKAQLMAWLNQGQHADMQWMTTSNRQDIRQVLPGVKSVISVALNYYTPHAHSPQSNHGKISRYGWGRDYHRILQTRLKALASWLQETAADEGVDIQVKYYVDTGPVQDKFWAEQAGLGWIAKNGNLITRRYGSWVFLGELLTTLHLEPDLPHTAHCGTCTRCLEACPTGAIPQPHVVDANRCIAYHTIENRAETLPDDIVPHLQNWVAGCDICQDVCPWNIRFAKESDIKDFQPYPWNHTPTLAELASLSEEEWDQRFRGSALRRIKPWMWRRNARAAQSIHFSTG